MINRKWLRYTLGVILGGCSGLSLTATVLPSAMAAAGLGESFMIRWDIAGYAAHATLAWAAGGWFIARIGKPKLGALLLGVIGFASGALICAASYGIEPPSRVFFSAIAAAAYGTIGGLLLGIILQPPTDEGTAGTDAG